MEKEYFKDNRQAQKLKYTMKSANEKFIKNVTAGDLNKDRDETRAI